MNPLRRILATAVAAIVFGFASLAEADPPFALSVKRDGLLGGSKGTLLFEWDRIEYRTTDTDDASRWAHDQIKQLQILSPTRIAVLTYEDQGFLKLGADRTFHFTVVEGAVSPELVRFVLDHVNLPVVTAVMPPFRGERLFSALVKHQRQGRGSEGVLVIYERELLYLTEREDESRFWRFRDVYSVLRLDRARLQVTVYEGGGGRTRNFVFELKTELPDGFYDALWTRVNPPSLDLAQPARSTRLSTGRQ